MKRPNILIIQTDQQRWDAVGANGNEEVITPNLDRLAAQGATFLHHYVQNPVCMPSRASFLLGQYPSTVGSLKNGSPVPEDAITLPRILRNYGYVSGNVGKIHFLPHANRDHRQIHPDYGFDHMEISDEPGCYEDVYRAWVRRKAPDQLPYISRVLPPAAQVYRDEVGPLEDFPHPAKGAPGYGIETAVRKDVTQAAFVAEQTMEFVRQRREGPFLCIAGIYAPHSPCLAPQEYRDLYDPGRLSLPQFPPEVEARRAGSTYTDAELRGAKHGYYAMVSEVDAQVGRMLAYLDELGIADETIVVFTSDHGEWLGEHLRYGKGYPGHDCVSRTPLIVRWPGVVAEGRRVEAVVEAIDVLPTLLAAAAIPTPPHLQGRSFLDLLEGRAQEGRDSALTEGDGWKSLRLPGLRYVVEASGKESLFDLRHDPGGYQNLAGEAEYAEALHDARLRLLQRLLQMERSLPRTWTY
ncbi:MAG: sulfatase-like hydrolase/transferase [Chloroflexi bacterium]|nr:sulfatase-like hydrolase/transferase [Chloroflexota bacterium]